MFGPEIWNGVGLLANITGVMFVALNPVNTSGPSKDGSVEVRTRHTKWPFHWQTVAIQYEDRMYKQLAGYYLIAGGFIFQFVALLMASG